MREMKQNYWEWKGRNGGQKSTMFILGGHLHTFYQICMCLVVLMSVILSFALILYFRYIPMIDILIKKNSSSSHPVGIGFEETISDVFCLRKFCYTPKSSTKHSGVIDICITFLHNYILPKIACYISDSCLRYCLVTNKAKSIYKTPPVRNAPDGLLGHELFKYFDIFGMSISGLQVSCTSKNFLNNCLDTQLAMIYRRHHVRT